MNMKADNSTQAEPELLPCPFCASVATISTDTAGFRYIHCGSADRSVCAPFPHTYKTRNKKEFAADVAAWNRRAT